MPGIGNNLYPPIVDTYMPAFVRTAACRIYFSLSIYNSTDEIKNVQIIITNQNNNLSAFAPGKYPAGIKLAQLQVDESVVGDDKYFVVINPEDLISGAFEVNQYYKVQLRFTGVGATNITNSAKIAGWLIDNQAYFSEWSTVCLIRGIQKPDVYLKGFENIDTEREIVFTSEVVEFVGSMYYSENEDIEKEYLKSYRIKVFRAATGALVYDSGDVFTNTYNPNEINYTLNTALEDGVNYRMEFTYKTVNEYSDKLSYLFSIVQNTIDSLDATISATVDEEYGRIKVDIVATITEAFFGNLTIRRSSSESNFTVWEDIHETTIADGQVLNYTWYDYTIESGVWYRYCAHRRNSKGDRGAVINIRYPVMAVFDDMFLTRNGMQLRLTYNPSVSSFKKTMLESKTDTLGSKYPFIRRNGNVGYRQFPISGLITAFCDDQGVFINRENVYGSSLVYYDNYNEEQDINEYQDFIYEREFRERVMDFLHANTIKLFRSTTEGNILIKLMDVSFTPNQTLGRMLYTFNATAYEIDDCSLANFNKYGVQYIGKYSTYLEYTFFDIGQLQGTYVDKKQDVLTMLQEKYSDRVTEKYINTVTYLKWLRIEFNMPPYLIKTAANGSIVPLPATEKPTEDTALGYIVYINNKPIIVSQRGFYELIDDDTQVTSVWFPVVSDVTIDYMAHVSQTENTSLLYNKMYFYTKVGQMGDTFKVNENVFLRIYQKYLLNYKAYHQQLLSLNKVSIEAVPGTVVYVRDSFDDDYFKHEVGPTGVLELYDPEAVVNGLYFGGIQLYEANTALLGENIVDVQNNELIRLKDSAISIGSYIDNEGITQPCIELNAEDFEIQQNTIRVKTKADVLKDNEFRYFNQQVNSLEDIKYPVKGGVYTVNGEHYTYYHGDWYKFSDDNVIECPVDALIDYIYESMKGEYQL